MYFGSVRFFKHLVVIMVLLIILGLAISNIHLMIINKDYKAQLSETQSHLVLMQSKEDDRHDSLSFEYQELYSDLYAKLADNEKSVQHTVYLTFDDGPSERTAEILDILENEDIHATFFIIGKDGEKRKDLSKRMTEHTS